MVGTLALCPPYERGDAGPTNLVNQRSSTTALCRKGIDLTPGGRECVLYRDLSMLVSRVI